MTCSAPERVPSLPIPTPPHSFEQDPQSGLAFVAPGTYTPFDWPPPPVQRTVLKARLRVTALEKNAKLGSRGPFFSP